MKARLELIPELPAESLRVGQPPFSIQALHKEAQKGLPIFTTLSLLSLQEEWGHGDHLVNGHYNWGFVGVPGGLGQ